MTLLWRAVRAPYVRARELVTTILFDRRYGVETVGSESADELGLTDAQYVSYMPIRLRSLRRLLPPRSVGGDDVFVDLGSGKGRAVLIAGLNYPFRRVEGVELSSALHETAERNVAAVRHRLRSRDVRLVRSDVLDYEVPDDVTVVLINNPFKGAVFTTVVERLLASVDRRPRRMRIIYGNPHEEAALLGTCRVRLVKNARGWRPGREWSRSNSVRLYDVLPAR